MAKAKSHMVHVVEMPDTSNPSNLFVTTFTVYVEAERLMFQLMKENGYEGDDFDEFIEEEEYVYENGDYMVLITTS